ncbi:MAG: MoxR-like protein ATPase [archaeon GW2011_AR18]|nr:MAG: MoxR-like protein ATPase [archaeon GW2011_AR18]
MVSVEEIHKRFKLVTTEVAKVVIGQEDVIEQMQIAVLCNGHALLEGYPGLAKTLLVKTVSNILDLRFSRIQGTPDLLPSDITGTYIIDESKGKKEFKFQPGPIFANVVLVDEVNRATPKTHSAILEAMQEKQVTIGNSTYKLEEPFFVLATMNPIEMEGSLTLDQDVFINGQLRTGQELLDYTIKNNIQPTKEGNFNLYKLPDSYTYSLNEYGKLEKSECSFYIIPCNDEVITLKTRIGREIKVTKNHPFLVNEKGEIKWKKAAELVEGDYLVSISKLDDEKSKTELMTHLEVLKELERNYKVIYYEDYLKLKELTNNFIDYTKLETGTEFDNIRIINKLEIKEIAKEIGLEKNEYWQLIRFLRRPTENIIIREKLTSYFIKKRIIINEPTDFIDSLRPISIKRFNVDEDITFLLAFILGDGSSVGSIFVAQKNYPKAFDRFVNILNNKVGVGVSYISKDKTGCRYTSKSSRPFVKYMCLRFGLKEEGHKTGGIPSWIIELPAELRREFLKTFICLEGCIRDNRIRFSQANKNSINLLSYMLLKEGIISWFSEKNRYNGKDYVIKIQGEDFLNYLLKIGWLDDETRTYWLEQAKSGKYSPFRVIPAPREMVLKLVDLLGINSFHTYKNRRDLLSRDWYCGYKSIKQGRENISLDMFKLMLKGLEDEIVLRENTNLETINPLDVRHSAVLCGLSITEIGEKINISHDAVWNYYETGNSNSSQQIVKCIQNEFITRITEARSILNYLKKLVQEGVIYDRVEKLDYSAYDGLAFGLTVPGLHNYIGGYGATGLNHNTFVLSEAQVDRFLFKIKVGYPKLDEEIEIAGKYSEEVPEEIKLKKIFDKNDLLHLQSMVKQMPIANDIKKYAVELVASTRNKKDLIEYGASPRASIALIMAGKAKALMSGRKYVSKDDINSMALPVLRHRIIPSFEAERQNMTEDDIILKLLKK